MKFSGVEVSPDLYLIDFHQELDMEQYPFAGERGKFIISLLGSYSLLSSVRLANMTMQGQEIVEQDIIEKQPKLIIGFGKEIIEKYLTTNRKITDISGEVFDINIKGNPFKLLVLMSPSYILRRIDDSTLSLKFSQDLYKAFQIINGEYIDILKEKEILNAHTFAEFKQICDKFKDDPEVAYDIETNARPPMMEGSKIIGFSIGNKQTGVYVSIDSLDFQMSKDEEDQIWDYLINELFLEKDKLIIHNTMYERPYTLYCKGYEIPYDKAHDTLVMARLLKNPKETAGLKFQAQKYLHYPDWETGLSDYISGVSSIINRIGLGPKKYAPLYFELSSLRTIRHLVETEAFLDLSETDKNEVSDLISLCFNNLVDLYTEEELEDIDKLLADKVIEAVDNNGIQDSVIPYNWVPDKLLSKYGAVDSLATFDLKDYFFNIMKEQSTDKINLFKGYENWLEHIYIAYIMERNGMYWDDDFAEQDRQELTEQATVSMIEMLTSPCFEPFIVPCYEEYCKPIILSDYYPNIAASQGYEVIYDHTLDKYTVKYNGKRVARDQINNIQISDAQRASYEQIIKQMFYEKVTKAKSYEDLKDIYNPSSVTSSNIPRGILLTPKLQIGGRITELYTLAENPNFKQIIDKLPNIDQKFLQIATYCSDVDLLKEQYGDKWAEIRKQFFEGFVNLEQNCKSQVTTPEILEILNNSNPVIIETFDDNGIITIYNNMVVSGIDPDDPKTWSPEFSWMISYRLFKKSAKLVSSYLDGVTGRASVAIVNKKAVQSGNHCVSRKRYYSEGLAKNDEDYLLMSKWGPNTAETGRWRSAQHTVPWNSQIKKYYSSRFVGGTTCCPDYSQMEVRTLGAVAHDENMLELFRSGKDFHTETAKKIFRKDEVTPAERRYSKTATFSLLYGSSAKSFADKYCRGDIDYANMIYDGFFEAYPKVKDWIEERHAEVSKDNRVSLELSNRFITILPESNDYSVGAQNAMLRKAQNYPIQGQSADLTGGVIFDLQRWIEENGMKSLIFMYVHDSIEVDIYPYELFKFITYLKYLLNEAPARRMGLPSEADVALGKSLGHEITLEEIETNEDMTEGTMTLSGYKDEIDETVETWKKAYKTVEVFDENYKDIFVSMGELFILRKAYTPTLGTTRQKGSCKVHIKYYE